MYLWYTHTMSVCIIIMIQMCAVRHYKSNIQLADSFHHKSAQLSDSDSCVVVQPRWFLELADSMEIKSSYTELARLVSPYITNYDVEMYHH